MEVTLARDGPAWRARPGSAAAGDFDVRLQRGMGTSTPPFGVSVAGLIRGLAINTSQLFQPVGEARVSFAGNAPATDALLDGSITPDGVIATGNVVGTVAFGNSRGAWVSCNSCTVHWSLSRLGF